MTSTNSYHQTSSNVLAVDLHPNQDLVRFWIHFGANFIVSASLEEATKMSLFSTAGKRKLQILLQDTPRKSQTSCFTLPSILFSVLLRIRQQEFGKKEKRVNQFPLHCQTCAGYTSAHTFKTHTKDVVGCSLHATGDFLVTGSLDQTWALHDIHTATTLVQVDAESGSLMNQSS
jgi:hypothetical protein